KRRSDQWFEINLSFSPGPKIAYVSGFIGNVARVQGARNVRVVGFAVAGQFFKLDEPPREGLSVEPGTSRKPTAVFFRNFIHTYLFQRSHMKMLTYTTEDFIKKLCRISRKDRRHAGEPYRRFDLFNLVVRSNYIQQRKAYFIIVSTAKIIFFNELSIDVFNRDLVANINYTFGIP